jgi:hypothetical protein
MLAAMRRASSRVAWPPRGVPAPPRNRHPGERLTVGVADYGSLLCSGLGHHLIVHEPFQSVPLERAVERRSVVTHVRRDDLPREIAAVLERLWLWQSDRKDDHILAPGKTISLCTRMPTLLEKVDDPLVELEWSIAGKRVHFRE